MQWIPLPPMPTPRFYQQAGLVTYPDGTKGILVAGGYRETSVEFLNLDTLIWEPKQRLPKEISTAASVPYQDSFLIVGGDTFGSRYDTIYYYNPGTDQWDLLNQTMIYERSIFAAFMVPDSYANCN